MRALSIHHLVAPEISAKGLVELAGDFDDAHACLFTQLPADASKLPAVREEAMKDLRRLISAVG